MIKRLLEWQKHLLRLTLALFLLFIFFGFSFAGKSSDSKVNSITIDKQLLAFVNSEKIVTRKSISEANKAEIRSLIALINKTCGKFKVNTSIFSSAECTTTDPKTGNLIKFSMNCQDGACKFRKVIYELAKIKTTPTNFKIQASPNVPSQSAVGLGRWMKVFSGLVYVALTIYLFVVAVSNLFKRELLFLIVDLTLWAILTAAMYVVMGGF